MHTPKYLEQQKLLIRRKHKTVTCHGEAEISRKGGMAFISIEHACVICWLKKQNKTKKPHLTFPYPRCGDSQGSQADDLTEGWPPKHIFCILSDTETNTRSSLHSSIANSWCRLSIASQFSFSIVLLPFTLHSKLPFQTLMLLMCPNNLMFAFWCASWCGWLLRLLLCWPNSLYHCISNASSSILLHAMGFSRFTFTFVFMLRPFRSLFMLFYFCIVIACLFLISDFEVALK